MNLRTLAAATLIAAAAITPATATADMQAAKGGTCAFFYDREPHLLHQAVVFGGYVKCYGSPSKVIARLTLFHKYPGAAEQRWSPVAATGVPNPALNVATMVLDCLPGLWQGRVEIEATWDTGTDKGYAASKWTDIDC